MAWIEVGGHDIYYVEAGRGQPLVFLHGMSSCGEAWWQQFEFFADRYRVIAFDSVNHGHSSNSPRDVDEPDRTDELEGFLAALGIARPILAGNSMGGATILRWAARHPGDAQALVVSGMGIAEPGRTIMRTVAPLDHETLFLPVGDSLTETLKVERPRMFERYLRIRSTATRLEYLRHPRPRNPKTVREGEALPARPGNHSPMLVIISSSMGSSRMRAACVAVPGSRYVEIDGAPHNVLGSGAAWNAAVGEFLAAT
jgi:pimeloyl-ACP methyl ester carboxylesterase